MTTKSHILSACVTILVLLSCSLAFLPKSKIFLENNEYTGILIAIDENVREDAALIENLKDIFIDASGALYRATQQRAFFKKITILLPNTWSSNLASGTATTEMFAAANIIVTKHGNVGRETPYTNQFGSCGEEAEYIHLTDKFILDKQWTTYKYGEPEKVIVHEWGHLRWGLFDEYATNDNEHFYLNEKGQVEQTGCSRFILGKEYDSRTGEQCSLNSKNRVLPDQHCRFYPQLENNQATGSYMHMSFLSSVVEFCHSDVTGDPLSLHNAMAPNQQNIQCSYRSAWDVMLESEDFKNDNNPVRQVTDTTPTFRVVKSAPLRIVLVLDVSGSMNDNNRISILNQGTRKYIRATVPDGNSVGIVSFSSSATITSYLKELKTLQDREDLASLLPTTASGGTCIGCGLRSGIEVLENGGNDARGGIILLITDGQESSSYPRIIDMKPTLIGKGVGVDTVAFGTLADEKLQSLSDDTGGLSFLHGEGESSTGLNDALTATINARIWGSSNVPFELHSEKREIPAAGNLIGSIIIDSTIGRHTKFFFLWSTSLISVVLRRPEGTAIDASAPEYKSDDGAKTVSIEISGIAEPGIWLYELTGSQQQVETLVKSVARYNTQPIVVSTTTSKSLVTELPAMTNIYVQVKMGYSPVFKANVTATVERPSTYQAVDVRLLDNGAGVDVNKDDGVYSGVFMDFVTATCPDCRYNIKVTAEETSWGAEVPVAGNSNSRVLPIMRPTDPIDERINLTQLIGRFKRVVSGGVIQAPLTIPPGDHFPPSRITDLRVIGTSYDDQTVTLEWTAPGNDLDRGTADEYDLRYSKNFSVLYKTFVNGTELTNSNLTAGNLSSPQPFGETETVIVQIPDQDENATLFFSVRARDAAGNVGQPSNIVSITVELGRYPDDVVTTTEFPSRMSSVLSSAVPQEGLPSRAVSTSLVVGCSLAGVAVVAVLITSLIIIKYKSSKKRKIHNLDAD